MGASGMIFLLVEVEPVTGNRYTVFCYILFKHVEEI